MIGQLRGWAARWGPWGGRAAGILALLLIGVIAGAAAMRYGVVVPLGFLAGVACALVALLYPWSGLLTATTIAILLPFAVLPIRLGFSPSFLELTLFGFLLGWLLPPLLRRDRRWRLTMVDGLVWAFVGVTLVALLLGWGRGVDAAVLHSYAKLLLGLLAFFGVRQVMVRERHLRQFLTCFLLAAGLAALLGVTLYALPDRIALNLLTRLEVVGYPTEGRVLRYVEDDPNGLERAIGTAVDPNSYGGMVALAASVTLGEVLAGLTLFEGPSRGETTPVRSPPAGGGPAPLVPLKPLLSRPLMLGLLILLLAALYLTYSRAALGGLAAAALFLACARYRRLWWVILAGAVLLAVLFWGAGLSGPVVERFRQGILFQDLANRMRLAEFANALAIVQRYPLFGVGLGNAPDVDLYLGVSNLYLAIAERTGLAGLVIFLAAVGGVLWQAWHRRLRVGKEAAGHLLALLSGVVAALTIGMLDHYFFNLEFPHMATLLWVVLGGISALGWEGPSGAERADCGALPG